MRKLSAVFPDAEIAVLRQHVADVVKARRLPWLCPACGARANHNGAHWHKSGETMCNTLSVWASDLPEPK